MSARPASPCVKLCRIEPASALCAGCLRSLDEISAWRGLDAAGREQVWQRIEQRAQQRQHLVVSPGSEPLPAS
jgi:predicted Fe-S protein YdhL (DUF1289 family)